MTGPVHHPLQVFVGETDITDLVDINLRPESVRTAARRLIEAETRLDETARLVGELQAHLGAYGATPSIDDARRGGRRARLPCSADRRRPVDREG